MAFLEAFRRSRAALFGSAIVAVALQSASAAAIQPTMTPKLRVGPAQDQVWLPQGAAAPLYGLFSCQVAGVSAVSCYDPYQMRKAYKLDTLVAAGFDGTGQTIVIVDAFHHPNLTAQLNVFTSFYGLPAVSLTQVAPDGVPAFDPSDNVMVGWAQETSLDVEWAHSIAPGAKIVVVEAKSSADIDIASALKYAVDNNLGSVISMSFGENESCVGPEGTLAYHQIFANATLKGITLFASSGDEGAAQTSCDGTSWVKAASSPANDPLVTGVGGTELSAAKYCLTSQGCDPSTNPAPGAYLSEIAWNEGPKYGDFASAFDTTLSGGGGFSVVFDEPPYQQSKLPGGKQRAVPDVSYSAAVEHGVLTYLSIPGIPAGFYLFGGTSAGAPQWSAIAAIADQKAGHRLGFLNKAIYQLTAAYPTYFNDISSGTNSSLQLDQFNNVVDIAGFTAGTGWDAATGTGSPNGSALVDRLISGVSNGDGISAVATSMPKPGIGSNGLGHVKPH